MGKRYGFDATIVGDKDLTQEDRDVQRIAARFGLTAHPTAPVSGGDLPYRGFVPAKDGRMFFYKHGMAGEALQHVIGHELVHNLRRSAPDLYDQLVKALPDADVKDSAFGYYYRAAGQMNDAQMLRRFRPNDRERPQLQALGRGEHRGHGWTRRDRPAGVGEAARQPVAVAEIQRRPAHRLQQDSRRDADDGSDHRRIREVRQQERRRVLNWRRFVPSLATKCRSKICTRAIAQYAKSKTPREVPMNRPDLSQISGNVEGRSVVSAVDKARSGSDDTLRVKDQDVQTSAEALARNPQAVRDRVMQAAKAAELLNDHEMVAAR